MAIAFRAQTTQTHSAATSTVITKPTGTVDGDVMVALINNNAPTGTISPPAGWTTIYEGQPSGSYGGRIWIGYKVAASEGANYTFTFNSGTGTSAIAAWSGVHNTDPVAATALAVSSENPYTFPATYDGFGSGLSLLVGAGEAGDGGTPTVPSGYTQRVEANVNASVYMAEKALGAAGVVASAATGNTGGIVDRAKMHLVLRDASVTPSQGVVRDFRTGSTGTAGTTVTLDVPRAANGDVLLAHIVGEVPVGDGAITVTPPSGWSLLVGPTNSDAATDLRSWIYYKVSSGTEPFSHTWTFSASNAYEILEIAAGAVESAVPDASSLNGNTGGDSTSPLATGVTSLVADSLLLFLVSTAKDGNLLTVPAGFTELLDQSAPGGATMSQAFGFKVLGAAGATGDQTGTLSTNTGWSAGLVALAPANRAPNAPALVAPAAAEVADLAAGYTFDWTFSDVDTGDAQSAFAIRRKIGAGAYEYYNVAAGTWGASIVWNTSTTEAYTFPASKWTNGNTYSWSVAVKDTAGLAGPFASDRSVVANTPSAVTVTGPTSPVTNASRPPVTWSFTDAESDPQQTFQVKIESGAYGTSPGSGTAVLDSGEVSSVPLRSWTPTADLVNGTTYRAFVRVKSGDLYSGWAYATFTLNLTLPAAPVLSASWETALNRVALSARTDHDTLQFPTTTVQIQRSDDAGGTWSVVRGASALSVLEKYLLLPGTTGNYATTPDVAALDLTTDLEIWVKVAMDDWTPATTQMLVGKALISATSGYYLRIDATTGKPTLGWGDGTARTATATVAPTVTDGAALWIKATLDVNNGAGGCDVKFYTSTDGVTFTQLGSTVTQAFTTSVTANANLLGIGGPPGAAANMVAGKIYKVKVYNGLGGTLVLDADFNKATAGASSFVEGTGKTVTVAGTASITPAPPTVYDYEAPAYNQALYRALTIAEVA